MVRRLHKSRKRLLVGVAGGIAEYVQIDPAIVRGIFILLSFASGLGVVLYVALALLMPRAEAEPAEPLAVLRENLKTAPHEAVEAGRRAVQILRGASPGARESEGDSSPNGGVTG